MSPALARELDAMQGSTVLIRLQRPSAIPLETLHGQRNDLGRTLRVSLREILSPVELGDFSIQPQQGDVLALFVPLDLLQRDLSIPDRVNVMLVSGGGAVAGLEALVRRHAALQDFGLSLRVLEGSRAISLESDAGLIDEARATPAAAVAQKLDLSPSPVLTYLASTIRSGDREIPYSLITALDLQEVAIGIQRDRDLPPIVLNQWAARDLAVTEDAEVTLEYDVWEDPGRIVSHSAKFYVAAIVPIARLAADRDLAPVYPGITASESLRGWDPPFPIDLSRIRPLDEQYWRMYRTTPKAFSH